MVEKRISVLVSYEKPFMASSVERLLMERGFEVIANVTDQDSIESLDLAEPPDTVSYTHLTLPTTPYV